MSYDSSFVDDAECIARFGYDSGYYRKGGTAKAKAFLPDGENEVSMFRIDDLSTGEIWSIGDEAGISRGKVAKVSIEILAGVVPSLLALTIDEPPLRHVVIEGWPDDHLRMQFQQELADAATVRFRPDA